MSSKIHAEIFWGYKTRWFFLLFLSSVVLFLQRKPVYLLAQPGRIEDVDVLLVQALQNLWQSPFVVYNYYFHFVPRIVTIFSLSLLGIANVNLGMNVAAIVIAIFCAMFFANKQFRFIIKNDYLRIACSFFIILVPGVNEIYSNISSIQWFLNIFVMLFTTLLLFRYDEYEKKSKKKKCLYAFFCAMSFLSSAFAVVLLPALVYTIMRELRRNKKQIFTISSYAIPTILLFLQVLTLYVTSQQSSSAMSSLREGVVSSSVNALTISISKIFYHDTPGLFQYSGELMYLIPIAVVGFILLNSVKNGIKLEAYALACVFATLFFSSLINKQGYVDWNCLCGTEQERYFFFAIVFSFILLIRQFDKRKSIPFRLLFAAVIALVILNVSSGYLIPTSADENWTYVAKLYDAHGPHHCYVGEVPHGWAISIPCSNPAPNNMTIISEHSDSTPSVTFTPPVQQTTTMLSSSLPAVSGLPVTFTAIVSPMPNYGTIQFQIDGVNAGKSEMILDGRSIFSTSSLDPGLHHISASYLGGPNFYPSTSDIIVVIVLSMSHLQGANLSGADLHGSNLSGINLKQTNLSGANLQKANLNGTDLQDANLHGANLQYGNLVEANLQDADLSGTILAGSNLSGANLKDANVEGANFADAITTNCKGCP